MEKKRNHYSLADFIICHIILSIPFFTWYGVVIFRNIGSLSLKPSMIILVLILFTCCAFGIFTQASSRKNGTSVIINLLFGFGFYSVITWYQQKRILVLILMVFLIIVSLLLLLTDVTSSLVQSRPMENRIDTLISDIQVTISLVMLVLMIIISVSNTIGPHIKPVKADDITSEQIINENIYKVSFGLEEDYWGRLNAKDRLDVLQIIVNSQVADLGCDELTLRAKPFPYSDNIGAKYMDGTKQILFDLDTLTTCSVKEACFLVTRECYNAYENKLIELYHSTESPDMLGLEIMKKAKQYEEELNYYPDKNSSYEIDAEEYADKQTKMYIKTLTSSNN